MKAWLRQRACLVWLIGICVPDKPETEKEAESQLIGLAGMIDPPRREVREAIATCRAGIKTVMITGDHRTTAEAIAAQLGILPRNGLSLSGQELSDG